MSWRRKSFLSKQITVRAVDMVAVFNDEGAVVVRETSTVLCVSQQRPPVCGAGGSVTFPARLLPNISLCNVVV